MRKEEIERHELKTIVGNVSNSHFLFTTKTNGEAISGCFIFFLAVLYIL
jgi:hypothetical protein